MKYELVMVNAVAVAENANGSTDPVEEFDTGIVVGLQYPVVKEDVLEVLRFEEILGEYTPDVEFHLALREFGMVDLYHGDIVICRLQRR